LLPATGGTRYGHRMASRTLVVGVDAGATTTRCVVATVDGVVVGRGVAGGANKNSSGGRVADTLATALESALSSVDRQDVEAGVLGAAGSAGEGRALFRTAATLAWHQAGLTGDLEAVTDLEVAFAAGTAEPDGVLLLSGTGALAARFAGGRLERRCDGYGWLLGDEGSAVWIGLRGLRAVLAALDGRGASTVLVGPACELLGVSPGDPESTAQALLAAGFARPPAELGRFAPAVSQAAEEGDPVALGITSAAAEKLLRSFDTVEPREAQAVVLAGSVLLTPGPVARAVRDGLLERKTASPGAATDGAAGAASLAVARLTGAPVRPAVHASLTGHASRRE
jgi:glucosamine kinase